MGYADAKADGIRIELERRKTVFYPRCFFCLEEVKVSNYIRSRRYVCQACRPKIKTLKKYYDDRESKNLFEAISREREKAHRSEQG